MNRKIDGLFHPDGVNDLDVAVNQLREGLQELILSALSRNGFSDKAVFHGGTCLRILYGLDRFSEDLDFSLSRETMVSILSLTLRNYAQNCGRSVSNPRTRSANQVVR